MFVSGEMGDSPALSSTLVLTRSVFFFFFFLPLKVHLLPPPVLFTSFQLNFYASLPPLANALPPSMPRQRWPPLPPFFMRRDTFVSSPFYPALLFLSAPTFRPTPSHLCANSSHKCFHPASLLFLSRTQTWTHFSVVTYSRLVILARYYYAVLYKHLNENCYGLLCLLDRPMLCCVFPLFR